MVRKRFTSEKTIGRKIAQLGYASLTLTGVLVGAGAIAKISGCVSNTLDTREIEIAIQLDNVELATALLEDYDGDIGDKVELTQSLEKSKKRVAITSLMQNGDYEQAHTAFLELEGTDVYSYQESMRVKQHLFSNTEAGLFEEITINRVDKKGQLCKKYMDMYPDGKNLNAILREYMQEELQSLGNEISGDHDYQAVLSHIFDLNQTLDKFTDEEIRLPKNLISDEVLSEYIDYSFASPRRINKGNVVKFYQIDNWRNEIGIQDRNAQVPLNSVGTVSEIQQSWIHVRFDNIEPYWEHSSEWLQVNGKEGAAPFTFDELKIGTPRTEFDKEKFKQQYERLQSRITYSQ